MAPSALAFSSPSPRYTEECPGEILFKEFRRLKPGLDALGIRFSVSRVKFRIRGGKRRKPPYFACCHNIGNLGNVNVVAFYYPLIGDWDLMGADVEGYRKRVHSALREEMKFSNGKMLNAAFSKYLVPRMEDVPELEIHLLNRPDLPSVGAGETPIVGLAPAVGNAIFSATGLRLRSLPLVPKGVPTDAKG